MIIAVFPGQGAQTPGFLSPWLELPGIEELVARFADEAQVDLVAAGTVWDADRIRDTAVAQPLIVAASLASFAALRQASTAAVAGVAGHSVGELAALAAAGVIEDVDALRLVALRGRAMAEAAAAEQTGMSAVLGGNEAEILALLNELDLTPANFNGGGQIVAAGALPALAALAESAPRGVRVIPLQVAGAFHTRYMLPAVAQLREAAAAVPASDPRCTLWTNRDGSVVTDGRTALELMVDQVAAPVRWDLCMAGFADDDVTGMIELAPAGTLTGLAKRALRGVPTVAVKTPEDLAAAAALLTGGDA